MPKPKSPVDFQPIMSDPNTPYFIDPGTVDQSGGIMANAVANLIPGAIRGYEGLQLRDQRLKQNEAIEQYENYVQEEDRVLAVGERRQEIEGIWDQFDSGLDKMNAVNLLEKDYNKNVDLLKRAKEQGKLSDDAFLAKMTSITRAAVTKNPWMEAELYSAAKTHLAAMGITDLLDERAKAKDAADRAAQDEYKFLRGRAADLGIGTYMGEPVEQLQARVNKRASEKFAVTQIKERLEYGNAFSEVEANELINSGRIYDLHTLVFDDHVNTVLAQIDADPKNVDNILMAAKLETKKAIDATRRTLGTAGASGAGKMAIEQIQKDYDDLYGMVVDSVTGKVTTDRAKRYAEFMKSVQDGRLRDKYDVSDIEFAKTYMDLLGEKGKELVYRTFSPEQKTDLARWILNIVNPQNGGDKDLNTSIGKEFPQKFTEGLATVQGNFSRRESQLAVAAMSKAVNNAYASNPENPTLQKQSLTAINSMLATVAKKRGEIMGTALNPEFSEQVNTSVAISMKDTVTKLDKAVYDVLNNPANKGQKIEIDLQPSGYLVISTGDPEADARFAKHFSVPINNALDAFAAANGLTIPVAAEKFFVKFLGKREPPPRDVPQNVPQPPVESLNTPPAAVETTPLPAVEEPKPEPIVDKKVIDRVGQAANELIEKRGMNSVEAYRFLADSYGIPLKDVMDAEHEYRMKNPPKVKEEKKAEKSSAASPDHLKAISDAIASLNKPMSIIRDKDGRVTGIA